MRGPVRVARVSKAGGSPRRGGGILTLPPSDGPATERHLPGFVQPAPQQNVVALGSAPWKWICSLEVHFGPRTIFGSGWIAGPRTIVTAAHVLHDDRHGGKATQVIVMPGRDGGTAIEKQEVSGESCFVPDEWLDGDPCGLDIGWILLPEPWRSLPGSIPCGVLPEGMPAQRPVMVTVGGYPMDNGWSGETQVFGSNRLLAASRGGTLLYAIDTDPGQSGSPVWINHGQGKRTAVGVHAYGHDDGLGSCTLGQTANGGCRFTPELLQRMGLSPGDMIA